MRDLINAASKSCNLFNLVQTTSCPRAIVSKRSRVLHLNPRAAAVILIMEMKKTQSQSRTHQIQKKKRARAHQSHNLQAMTTKKSQKSHQVKKVCQSHRQSLQVNAKDAVRERQQLVKARKRDRIRRSETGEIKKQRLSQSKLSAICARSWYHSKKKPKLIAARISSASTASSKGWELMESILVRSARKRSNSSKFMFEIKPVYGGKKMLKLTLAWPATVRNIIIMKREHGVSLMDFVKFVVKQLRRAILTMKYLETWTQRPLVVSAQMFTQESTFVAWVIYKGINGRQKRFMSALNVIVRRCMRIQVAITNQIALVKTAIDLLLK